MEQSKYRIWLQPGNTVGNAPKRWGGIKIVSRDYFNIDGIDVVIEGNGDDLELFQDPTG